MTAKRVSALFCAFVFSLLCLGGTNVHALDSSQDLCPLPQAVSTSGTQSLDTASIVGVFDTTNDIWACSTTPNTLFFAYRDGNNTYPCFVTPSSNSTIDWSMGYYKNTTGVWQVRSTWGTDTGTVVSSGLRYKKVTTSGMINKEYDYVFSSLAAGLEAAANYQWPEPLSSTFTVPAGYVVYFKSNGQISLRCQQNQYSIGTSNPWPDSKQYYGSANSLPAANTTFPLQNSSLIPWGVGYPRDTFGRSFYSVSSVSAGPVYTYIFNQMMNYLSSDQPQDYKPNGTITITATNVSDIRLYPVYMTYDTSNGVAGYFTAVSSNTGGYSEPIEGVVDPETGQIHYEDSNGQVYVPVVGGENYMPESETTQGFLDQIVGVLKALLSEIGSLFTFAYEAVASLVSLASPFFSKLGALYSWLPSPVSTALTSAMILAITIGVLKSFL